MKRFGLALLTSAALAVPGALPAVAQSAYPARPITLVVPFAAGGPNDVMSRIVGEHMGRTLGQPVIIENSAGAGGTSGSGRVAQASPDGYTLVSGHVGTHAAAPALYPNLRYNPLTDFTPIGQVAETPILIATKRDFPAADLAAFVAVTKARGASLSLGHAGVGSISHISCLLLTSTRGSSSATTGCASWPYRRRRVCRSCPRPRQRPKPASRNSGHPAGSPSTCRRRRRTPSATGSSQPWTPRSTTPRSARSLRRLA